MLTMRSLTAALAFALPLTAHGSTEAVETFKYALRISGGKSEMKAQMLSAPVRDEQVRKALLNAADSYNFDEVSQRASELVARHMKLVEAKSCIAFIHSSAGDALLKALETAENQKVREEALQKLPAAHQQSVRQFMASSCYQKAVSISTSSEFYQIQNEYGSYLVCAQYKLQDASLFSRAVEKGICPP